MLSLLPLMIATALAADTGVAPVQTAPKHPAHPPRARVTTTKKKKGDLGNARSGSQMPPAGSAATGGTSASPGGAPTTPYGSPY